MKESIKKAKAKYKAKVKRITVDFYPTEADLFEHLAKQPKKQTYIKSLIRADMEKPKPVTLHFDGEAIMKAAAECCPELLK